jgi:hypothetical protein
MKEIAKLLEQSSQGTNMGYTTSEILLQFAVTLLLSLFIYVIYRITYIGVAYSKNFNLSIILTTLVTAMVMMVISSNLALSLGMVGALSIVRFRSAIKEPKDVGFLFWGIAAGLAAGTGSFVIAVVGSVFIGLIMLLSKFGAQQENHYLLILKGATLSEDNIRTGLSPLVKRFKLKTRQESRQHCEMIFEVSLHKNKQNIIDTIKTWEGVEMANLVTYNGEIS